MWASDPSKVFLAAVAEWLEGFHKVRDGLDVLNTNMQTYSKMTTSTENDNTTLGGWC